ncbi:hypothetical protein [Citrobacter koseri]|uniref:hypothetical protein n=1 Tax=Citrobacter koseri TaxID=545 RepID=UPI00389222EE
MNKVKMLFVADNAVSDELLHCLYTSVRFKDEKVANLEEEFKIWREGRMIHIIIDEDKIENDSDIFSFYDASTKRAVRVKLLKKSAYTAPDFEIGEVVDVSGVFSYSYKYRNDNDAVEVCPINLNGKFKPGSKQKFLNYIQHETGLNFIDAVDSKDDVRVERLFTDEQCIYNNNVSKKVLFRNVIMLRATVKVVDPEKVKALFTRMVGKRKSYGFGHLAVERVVA